MYCGFLNPSLLSSFPRVEYVIQTQEHPFLFRSLYSKFRSHSSFVCLVGDCESFEPLRPALVKAPLDANLIPVHLSPRRRWRRVLGTLCSWCFFLDMCLTLHQHYPQYSAQPGRATSIEG